MTPIERRAELLAIVERDANSKMRPIARQDRRTLLALVREMREQLQAVYVCFDFNGKYKSCESIAALLAATKGV